jgi:hypothetical protein
MRSIVGRAPGEGAFLRFEPIVRALSVETPPHPDPLPASGARERAAFAEPLSMNSDKFIVAAAAAI